MDWQQAGALVIVAVTAALFVRGAILSRKRGAPTCGGNCSCTAGTETVVRHPPSRS